MPFHRHMSTLKQMSSRSNCSNCPPDTATKTCHKSASRAAGIPPQRHHHSISLPISRGRVPLAKLCIEPVDIEYQVPLHVVGQCFLLCDGSSTMCRRSLLVPCQNDPSAEQLRHAPQDDLLGSTLELVTSPIYAREGCSLWALAETALSSPTASFFYYNNRPRSYLPSLNLVSCAVLCIWMLCSCD